LSGPDMDSFIATVLEGDSEEAVSLTQKLLGSGVRPEHVVIHGVEPAMTSLSAKCTLEEFNLLEIMLAGRAVMEVMKYLYPAGTTDTRNKGTVVIASMEGDVHDLGKNILKMVLIAKGYHVVDCGKDCPLQKLLETAAKEFPLAIGISGLITPIIPLVRQVKEQLALRGLGRVKVIAGGAALKQSSPHGLNVDFVAETAFDSLGYLEKF
jgi:dimethylamine corrinoid protein